MTTDLASDLYGADVCASLFRTLFRQKPDLFFGLVAPTGGQRCPFGHFDFGQRLDHVCYRFRHVRTGFAWFLHVGTVADIINSFDLTVRLVQYLQNNRIGPVGRCSHNSGSSVAAVMTRGNQRELAREKHLKKQLEQKKKAGAGAREANAVIPGLLLALGTRCTILLKDKNIAIYLSYDFLIKVMVLE
ncbi:hypothetical protein Aduo_000659 [Ancylostoma duodenale]